MQARPSGRPYTKPQKLGDGVKTASIFACAIGGLVVLFGMIIFDRLKGQGRSVTPTPTP
ncbi:MAG TPA: hypothetical protein VIY48_10805 [Candidatus Paceibacterota bacterium]